MTIQDLLLLHDGNSKVRDIAAALARHFPIRPVGLADAGHELPVPGGTEGAVICLGLSNIGELSQLLEASGTSLGDTVVVIPGVNADYAERLRRLGVVDYFIAPVDPQVLVDAVRAVRIRVTERSWQSLPPARRDALVESRSSFLQAFADVRDGTEMEVENIERAGHLIASVAGEESLTEWLDAIQDHHDYTFRHCISVCGSIVEFGHAIGIRSQDLELVSVGGLLHDIGKAWVSRTILDKPARLDDEEVAKMRRHPGNSREIMQSMDTLDRRVFEMAVSHHEKLDGTGYPDGLRADQISDLVRLTTIADIFSALIDERAYKPAMSYEMAFARMEEMSGHLDLELLARFKEFALDSGRAAA